jgi:hypothetical protein
MSDPKNPGRASPDDRQPALFRSAYMIVEEHRHLPVIFVTRTEVPVRSVAEVNAMLAGPLKALHGRARNQLILLYDLRAAPLIAPELSEALKANATRWQQGWHRVVNMLRTATGKALAKEMDGRDLRVVRFSVAEVAWEYILNNLPPP